MTNLQHGGDAASLWQIGEMRFCSNEEENTLLHEVAVQGTPLRSSSFSGHVLPLLETAVSELRLNNYQGPCPLSPSLSLCVSVYCDCSLFEKATRKEHD